MAAAVTLEDVRAITIQTVEVQHNTGSLYL